MTELLINMAGTTEAVPETVDCISRFSAGVGLDPESTYQIRVVLAEALNNIIAYALLFNRKERIQVACLAEQKMLTITIRDNGLSLKMPSAYGCPHPDEPCPVDCAQCGRGWPIIKHWADGIDYQCEDNRNTLTISKRIGTATDAGHRRIRQQPGSACGEHSANGTTTKPS